MRINLFGTDEQRDIIECDAEQMLVIAGRRWGKNFALRNRHVKRVLTKGGIDYLHAAPSYSQVQNEWERLAFHPSLQHLISSSSKKDPYPIIRWINGSSSHFRSLDRPDNLRNGEYNEAIIDESQNVDEDIISTIIEPMLSSRLGTLIMAGQFRGEDWRYERYYLPGQDDSKPWIKSWCFPSSSGLIFQGPKGIRRLERIKETVPRMVWEQEYDCIPSANQCGVFRSDDINASICNTVDGTGGQYIIGLDLGMIEDPAAVAVLDCQACTFIHSHIFPIGQAHQKTAQDVSRIAAKYGNCTVVMDSTAGATGGRYKHDEFTRYYHELIENVQPYYWNKSNKTRMINNFSLALENREVKITRENRELIAQLKMYEYKKRKFGDYEFSGPGGKKDDLVAAAIMALEGKNRGWYGGEGSSVSRGIVGSIGG